MVLGRLRQPRSSRPTRRGFQDMIATLAARLTEKNVPVSRATQLATHAWSSVEGALILSRVLRRPEPFDLAIAQLAATAETDAAPPPHDTRKDTVS